MPRNACCRPLLQLAWCLQHGGRTLARSRLMDIWDMRAPLKPHKSFLHIVPNRWEGASPSKNAAAARPSSTGSPQVEPRRTSCSTRKGSDRAGEEEPISASKTSEGRCASWPRRQPSCRQQGGSTSPVVPAALLPWQGPVSLGPRSAQHPCSHEGHCPATGWGLWTSHRAGHKHCLSVGVLQG